MANNSDLSERERDILKLVATGISNKEIARELQISTNTVKVHLRNIFTKINVLSRTEATLYAMEHGIVESPGNLETGDNRNGGPGGLFSPKRRWVTLSAIALVLLLVVTLGWYFLRLPEAQTALDQIPNAEPTTISRWQELAPLPAEAEGISPVVYDNQIYLFTGQTDEGVLITPYRYDIKTNHWTPITSKPTPVKDAQAILIGEKIYIPGGENGKESISSLEAYDPRLNTWEQKSPLPVPCSGYAASSMDGKLYLFGGWNGSEYLDSVFMYDPVDDIWQRGSDMPTARAFAQSGVANGKIYVIGGTGQDGLLSISESYTPGRDRNGDQPWQTQPALPAGQEAHGLQSIGDVLFVVSRNTSGQYSILQFLPQEDQWTVYDEIPPTQINGHFSVAAHQGYLYLLGGRDESGKPLGYLYRYQFLYMIYIPSLGN